MPDLSAWFRNCRIKSILQITRRYFINGAYNPSINTLLSSNLIMWQPNYKYLIIHLDSELTCKLIAQNNQQSVKNQRCPLSILV